MCTVLLFLSSEDQQQGRMEVYGSSCWGSRFSYDVHPNRGSIHKEINHYSAPARIIGSLKQLDRHLPKFRDSRAGEAEGGGFWPPTFFKEKCFV